MSTGARQLPTLRTASASMLSDKFVANVVLLVLGFSATIYVDLAEIGEVAIRPVQLVPVMVAIPVLLLLPAQRRFDRSLSLWIPVCWVGFVVLRFGAVEGADLMTVARAAAYLTAYVVCVRLLLYTRSTAWLWAGLAIGVFLSAGLAWTDAVVFGDPCKWGTGRWLGLMPGPNRFATICGITLVAAVPGLVCPRSIAPRLLALGVVVVALVGILSSGSRGGLAAAAVATLLAVVLSARAREHRINWALVVIAPLAVCLAGAVGFYYCRDLLPERVVLFVEGSDEGIIGVEDDPRIELYEAAFDEFRRSPIIGGGADAQLLETSWGRAQSSHNIFLHLLSTSGVVGLVLFLSLPALLAVRLAPAIIDTKLRNRRAALTAAQTLAVMVFVLLHSLSIDLTCATDLWIVFGAAAYACLEFARQRDARSPNRQGAAA